MELGFTPCFLSHKCFRDLPDDMNLSPLCPKAVFASVMAALLLTLPGRIVLAITRWLPFPRCCHPCLQARTQAFCLGKLVIYFCYECGMPMTLFQCVLLAPSPTVSIRPYSYISTSVSHFIFVNKFISTVFQTRIYALYIFSF